MKTDNTNPEKYAEFYTSENLGLDERLVTEGFYAFKPFFTGQNALELGPAIGYMTKFLVNEFDHLTVVEGSKKLLTQIPDHPKLTKIHCLFEDFTPEVEFDTIIMNHVLEHIEYPVELLKRIRNWLKKDGIFIVGVPNAKSFHRLAAVAMGLLNSEYELNGRDKKLGHFRVYDLSLLRQHVLTADFRIIKEGGLLLKFLSNSQTEKLLDKEIIDAYFKIAPDFYENSAEIFLILGK